jgi:hypothetical protein
MNSPTKHRGRRWIITTCRGRVDHLRVSLPSWLELAPSWDPIVVCCDDPVATEYVSGELVLAHRGICLELEQGQYFNRLEAIRVGLKLARAGFDARGQTIGVRSIEQAAGCVGFGEDDMVALLDADTVAIRKTEALLDSIDSSDVGICGFGTRDDIGFLVCSVRVLTAALAEIPEGMFQGYGPEDSSTRVACWAQVKRPFVLVPALWARQTHSDALRTRFHRVGMAGSVPANALAMGELMARLLAPEEIPRCEADCLQWPQRRSKYAG